MNVINGVSNRAALTDAPLANKLIVEISDILIRATHYPQLGKIDAIEPTGQHNQQGHVVYAEPGIALLPKDDAPIIGHEAQLSFKQHPTRIHSQFWSNLNTEPLNLTNSPVRHNGDLVWHQLSKIKQQTDLDSYIFLIPANFTPPQMQLLAGICQSLEINVDFFANMGLAQLISYSLTKQSTDTDSFIHIDSHLHQLLLSTYKVKGQSLELIDQEAHIGLGLVRLIDRLLHLLSEKFIQHSRFDPLHSGDTEQQLFDQLMPLLMTDTQITTQRFTIETQNKNHQIELSQQELNAVIRTYMAELHKSVNQLSQSAVKTYSPFLSQLSGFEKKTDDIALHQQDIALGTNLISKEKSNSTGMSYMSSYSSYKDLLSDIDTKSVKEFASSDPADAIVINNRLYTQETFYLLSETNFPTDLIKWNKNQIVVSSNQLTINGEKAVAGQVINTGDKIASSNSILDTKLNALFLAVKIAQKASQ